MIIIITPCGKNLQQKEYFEYTYCDVYIGGRKEYYGVHREGTPRQISWILM